MKRFFPMILTLVLIFTLAIAGCGGGKSGGGNPGGPTYTPGQSVTYIVGGGAVGSGTPAVSFNMNYAPNDTFPSDDSTVNAPNVYPTTITVSNAFWIAQTDVTYELWNSVSNWATSNGYNLFNFEVDDQQCPVASVSWREAVVWCNALTEYYNATSKASLACVYTYSGAIVKDPTDDITFANLTIVSTAKGFRLPTSDEWELAARYQNGTDWTPVDHVSGDTSGYCYNFGISSTPSSVFGNYAWWGNGYGGNCTSTQIVGTAGSLTPKTPCTGNANALGLYDMSGNVWQWCFDTYGNPIYNERAFRGGSWRDDCKWLALGWIGYGYSTEQYEYVGLRPVKTR